MRIRFSYILISILALGIFLAPISPILEIQTETKSQYKFGFGINNTEAEEYKTVPPIPGDYWRYSWKTSFTSYGSNYSSYFSTPEECEASRKEKDKELLYSIDKECSKVIISQETADAVAASSDTKTYETLWSNTGNCGIGNIIGCFEQIVYFFAVVIPSWLLIVAAKLFDVMATITLSNVIYKSPFVLEIWKIARDFANIFFILILLYAAFQIILGLGNGGGKKIVGTVILMALLINFSLFFSRVIIDSSNVLGLIFYNKIECKQTDGTLCPTTGEDAPIVDSTKTGVQQKNLALALISNFDINLFYKGDFITKLRGDPNSDNRGDDRIKLSNTLVLSLSVLYGIVVYSLFWVFLVTSLSFFGRTVMLLLLMIVSPLAFTTASIPLFSSIDTIGFKSWIKKLFENAFVATVFMAILYLIAKIASADIFSVLKEEDDLGVIGQLIVIFAPAMLIVVLLKKGSDYAKKASAEVTGAVLSGAKVLGGLALGGVALGAAGAAAVGRNTVGSFMKGASTGDTAAQRYERGESMGRWDRFKGSIGSRIGMSNAQRWVGSRVNRDQSRVEGYQHARHELDKEASARFNGKKFSDLTQPERDVVRTRISRDHEGQNQFGRVYNRLTAAEKTAVDRVVNPQLTARTSHADGLVSQARGKQGLISKVVQSSRTGSYDVRDLSKIVPDEYDRNFSKIAQGITGAIAKGMRGGLKSITGIDHGEGQKNFFKDLGNTLTEALKNTKIKVDLSGIGEVKKESAGKGH